MKARKNMNYMNASNFYPINRFYFNITREKMGKSFFYQELLNNFIKGILNKNFKKQLNGRCYDEDLLQTYRLINGKKSIPHLKKREKGGEDYHYAIDRLLVIADGVGGWKNHHVDPKDFPRELCDNISDAFHQYELSFKIKEKYLKQSKSLSLSEINYDDECKENCKDGIYSEKIAKKLLIKAASMSKCLGSSTCTILLLDKISGKLFTSYIGDSCYLILRYDILRCKYYKDFKSEEQMHMEVFNTPYQIGKENGDGDDPESALTNTHELVNNDLIITATDGLWDNLFVQNIIELVNENCKNFPYINVQDLANIIAEKAEITSNKKNYLSPFTKKASDHNKYYIGGKPDDITVIVSHFTNSIDKFYYDSSTNTSTTDNNEKNEEFLF